MELTCYLLPPFFPVRRARSLVTTFKTPRDIEFLFRFPGKRNCKLKLTIEPQKRTASSDINICHLTPHLAMASVEADDWRVGLSLLQRQQYILDGQYGSDVTFLVGKGDKKEAIKAHKFPLIAGSAVFEAMVDRWTVESSKSIVITDTEPSSFKSMLRFLYSEAVTLTGDNVMPLLYLSKKYLISQLTKLCVEFLQKQINIDNVCTILDDTIQYNEAELSQKCVEFVGMNAERVISSKRFRQLRNQSLEEILKCDDLLGVSEVAIYKACMEWADDQCGRDGKAANDDNRRAALGEALYHIRFPTMSTKEFAEATRYSHVLTAPEKVVIYDHIAMHDSQNPCNCTLMFNMKLRFVKVTVSRFSPSGVRSGWVVVDNTGSWAAQNRTHAIDFVCNKQALLQGVGLYTTEGGNQPGVTVQLLDQNGQVIESISGKTLTSVGVPTPERVDFTNAVLVAAGERYTITATLNSWTHNSYYGSQGITTVNCGSLTVTFHTSNKDNVGNCVNQGQIPDLYFGV